MIQITPTERYFDFLEMRNSGKTYREIADKYGISRQAVMGRVKKGKPKPQKTIDPLWVGVPKWKRQGRERVRGFVRLRDKYTCQDCGKVLLPENVPPKGKSLDVHHLNGLCGKKSRGYDKKEDMHILVTLCHKCHYNRPEHTSKKLSKERAQRNIDIAAVFASGVNPIKIAREKNLTPSYIYRIVREQKAATSG